MPSRGDIDSGGPGHHVGDEVHVYTCTRVRHAQRAAHHRTCTARGLCACVCGPCVAAARAQLQTFATKPMKLRMLSLISIIEAAGTGAMACRSRRSLPARTYRYRYPGTMCMVRPRAARDRAEELNNKYDRGRRQAKA